MHLIRTKLHRPRVLADIVCRGRLHALMDRGLESTVTLVSAPAGYGKSVLVSHWADAVEHPIAWISLDESDSDLTQFLDYLTAALDEALPGACPALNDLDFFKNLGRFSDRLSEMELGREPRCCVLYGGDVSQRRSQARVLSWRDVPSFPTVDD